MPSTTSTPYVDTSALAKWYLNEPFSDAVDAYLSALPGAVISSLTVVEMRSLLARRRRHGEITAEQEMQCQGLLHDDIGQGHLQVLPLEDGHAQAALRLLDTLADHPLRTLDALHLAIARSAGLGHIATADRVMAEAARSLQLTVTAFLD